MASKIQKKIAEKLGQDDPKVINARNGFYSITWARFNAESRLGFRVALGIVLIAAVVAVADYCKASELSSSFDKAQGEVTRAKTVSADLPKTKAPQLTPVAYKL